MNATTNPTTNNPAWETQVRATLEQAKAMTLQLEGLLRGISPEAQTQAKPAGTAPAKAKKDRPEHKNRVTPTELPGDLAGYTIRQNPVTRQWTLPNRATLIHDARRLGMTDVEIEKLLPFKGPKPHDSRKIDLMRAMDAVMRQKGLLSGEPSMQKAI